MTIQFPKFLVNQRHQFKIPLINQTHVKSICSRVLAYKTYIINRNVFYINCTKRNFIYNHFPWQMIQIETGI